MLTILENRDVSFDGELSKEDQVKFEAFKAAESRKKILEAVIFEVFILVSLSLQDLMSLVSEKIKTSDVHKWESDE